MYLSHNLSIHHGRVIYTCGPNNHVSLVLEETVKPYHRDGVLIMKGDIPVLLGITQQDRPGLMANLHAVTTLWGEKIQQPVSVHSVLIGHGHHQDLISQAILNVSSDFSVEVTDAFVQSVSNVETT